MEEQIIANDLWRNIWLLTADDTQTHNTISTEFPDIYFIYLFFIDISAEYVKE